MSALERSQQQAEMGERIRLLAEVRRRFTVPQQIDYATRHALPPDVGRWSTEQLKLAANSGGSPVAIPKKTKQYLVSFPEARPNKATAVVLAGDAPAAPKGTKQFVVGAQDDLKGAPMPVLLALVNANVSVKVAKFADEGAAVEAAWKALTSRAEPPKADGTAAAPAKAPAKARTIAYEPKAKEDIRQVKAGTKVARAIELLAGGVLITVFEAELSKTGRPISARGWLGYDVNKVVGYGVKSYDSPEGLMVKLVYPKGMTKPLPEKVVEVKAPKAPKAPAVPAPGTPATKKSAEVPSGAAALKAVGGTRPMAPKAVAEAPVPKVPKGKK